MTAGHRIIVHHSVVLSPIIALAALALGGTGLPVCLSALPTVNTPDPEIREVFEGNWHNTLKPSQLPCGAPVRRAWMVDLGNRYYAWYAAIDAKYQTRAFLFCEKNLPLVLIGWRFTTERCRLPWGSVIPAVPGEGIDTAIAFRSLDRTVVAYPLRATATIDYLLMADMIFRFSRDRAWLNANIEYLREAARWLEGWIDDRGLLDSEDYEHDSVMRRGTDGTAQASAYLAFRKLAAMEDVLGNTGERDHDAQVTRRLADGAREVLWSKELGYFYEYAETNDIARSDRLGVIGGASSELDPEHAAAKAIDGILGYGSDMRDLCAGAGQREWVANGETTGAWLQVNLRTPTAINRVILYNRQAVGLRSGEAFAAGRLDFSDGTSVPVCFGPGVYSRAVVPFTSRTVTWVKFTGGQMQSQTGAGTARSIDFGGDGPPMLGRGSAGLAEFEIHPTAEPYLKHTHGMTDVNFALVGYGVADDAQARSVWRYFKAHEDAFYYYNGVACPTWTAEQPEAYTGAELNAINSNKDRTAFGRIWRHDVWMRKRMGDGEGIYKTITYANAIYRRPSGGGVGFFGERYDLGRFTPGDDGQDSTPKYCEYPAEYDATVVGKILLGASIDEWGVISIDPCVPAAWYKSGFGIEDPGLLESRDLGYHYYSDRIEGWIKGAGGGQTMRVLMPPEVRQARVRQDGRDIAHRESGRTTGFTLTLRDGVRSTFVVETEPQGSPR